MCDGSLYYVYILFMLMKHKKRKAYYSLIPLHEVSHFVAFLGSKGGTINELGKSIKYTSNEKSKEEFKTN